MKKVITLTILALSILLAACYQNPLTTTPKKQLILMLLQASRHAEKAMSLYSPPGGGYYLSCMSANEGQIDCPRFFKYMLAALQQTSTFKSATLAQLMNQQLFERVALDYQLAFFNAVEE